MNLQEIQQLLTGKFGETIILSTDEEAKPPVLQVSVSKIAEVCRFLHEHEQTYFDYLSCLTALDNGPEENTMEVIYHLYSIPYNFQVGLKVVVERVQEGRILPQVPTVSHIWRSADWHEREAFDLLGIVFTGHPDLRRILLPADWKGHPLRKDYQEQEYYHGVKVEY
jgi:NADH-quinone oxidoreductase subunit C